MKRKYLLYIILFLLISIVPSAGLCLGGPEESAENRDVAAMPVLFMEDGGINPQFLGDAGAWFEDHFAYRNEWVTAHAKLMAGVFGVSAQESVIVGENGWLYYKDSLEDFQGSNPMTERQLFNAAHSLAMIQAYARERGIRFVFAAAPNKNSLYGENMPYYYQAYRSGTRNLERFLKYLDAEHVNYVDLYELLQKQGRVLYHARDSHWNNEGAALAADAVLRRLGKEHPSYTDRAYKKKADFEGDLDRMLYPSAITKEEEIYYDPMPQFTYQEEVESNFAPKIRTNSSGSGSLVMYRDSFGNALLPYFAEAYGEAYFSRGVPYYLPDLDTYEADTLVIERAERFLPELAGQAAQMEAPPAEAGAEELGEALDIIGLETAQQGEMTRISGKVPADRLEDTSRIFIGVNGEALYEAFPITREDGQEGFSMLLPSDSLSGDENKFTLYLSASKEKEGE